MKVPLSWLKDFLPLTATPQAIADTLTLLGIEVEKIIGLTTSFSGIVIGKILEANLHPNADRLRVANVTDGTEKFQVVCGAPNCRAGITVAFAKIGAELTDDEGKKWKIKKSKIRDVESQGMLCSQKELHVSEDADGIIELPSGLLLGSDLTAYLSDPVFDISLTPNLGHALSILGIARELAAAYKSKVRFSAPHAKEVGTKKMEVEVANGELCPRYACRIMTHIKVGPSPEWLQKRLTACGLRSINNIVDASNYVMLELGQPLHVFDLDKVEKKIVIAPALEPTLLETLDGQKREVPPQTLLIHDAEKPLAIAGIMGGLSSAATEKTVNILIEAAIFSPRSIRKSSRLLDLKTDSSYRFERGVDGGNVAHALDRVATLIQEIAGGEIHPLVDVKQHDFIPKVIQCRLPRLQQMLGFHLSMSEASALFERLEMQVKISDAALEVTIPTYRNDIQNEIDLVEEAARIFGYNNIPRGRPIYTGSTIPDTPLYRLEKELRLLVLEQGLQECITCDLISPTMSHLTMEKGLSENSTIHVLHPRSIDQSVLRTSLLPGLLQVVKHNANYQIVDVPIFEVGRIHFRENSDLQEASCVGIILTGKSSPHHFGRKPYETDFFDLKGVIESLSDGLHIPRYTFELSYLHTLHPWRQAKIKCGDVTIGVIGEVHPELLLKLDLHERVYFAEMNLNDILPLRKKGPQFSGLAAFPSSERDWTVTLRESAPMAQVLQFIEQTKSPYLEHFYLLDVYTSDQLGKNKKNVTFRFVYRDPAKTMAFEVVEQEHQKLTHSVAEKLRDCL